MDDPIIIPIPGLRPLGQTGESARWGTPMLGEGLLTVFTAAMSTGVLLAEAVDAPRVVTWPMVFSAAIGLGGLWLKLRYQYQSQLLQTERYRGERDALAAENQQLRAIRLNQGPSAN